MRKRKLRILLASQDRDLLDAYETLLKQEGHDLETAFDGIKVMVASESEEFDLLIMSQDLPLVDNERIIAHCRQKQLAVLVLMTSKVRLAALIKNNIANDYLMMPFTARGLKDRISEMMKMKKETETVKLKDVEFVPAQFTLGKSQLTLEEVTVLKKLASTEMLGSETDSLYVGSLNEKLEREGSQYRISYDKEKGYMMEAENG